MTKVRSRYAHLIALVASALLSVQAHAQQAVELDIASQPLSEALRELGTVSNTNIIFEPAMVKGVVAPALKGSITREEALTRLLAGTKWSFKFVDENTVSLVPGDSKAAAAPVSLHTSPAVRSPSSAVDEGRGEELRLAQAANLNKPDNKKPDPSSSDEGASSKIQEIVVTAQKRGEELLLDVPVPVTAVAAEGLIDSNQLRIQDYYTRVPGLNVTFDGTRGALPNLVIRGITSGLAQSPTVGILVDDVSYGSSSATGTWAPDIDPADLSQIEVLRGPQGTLYGASSMGGLLKYVTVDPSFDQVNGRVQVGSSNVRNGDGLGHNLRAAVNVPLSETWAIRASAFTRLDPGYIDDPELGTEGVNKLRTDGGRIAALWRPSEMFSLKLSAALQNAAADGSSEIHVKPGLGDLQQSALRGNGWFRRRPEVYNSTLTAKLGRADLISVSGYNISTMTDSVDTTGLIGLSSVLLEDFETKKWTQELRLSLPVGRLDWMVGTYYTQEKSRTTQDIQLADSSSGGLLGSINFINGKGKFEEYAVFTNLTFNFTDQFDVQIGGRQSHISGDGESFASSGAALGPKLRSEDNAFTYLLSPRFKFSESLMAYARLASGYRAGGANSPLIAAAGLPASVDPDTTRNYEIGVKGRAYGGKLSFDTSVYYIDWKDLQLPLYLPGVGGYNDNAGAAKSQGVEASVVVKLADGLSINAWGAWSDAKLTEDFPPGAAFGNSGDRLPFSSHFSGKLSLEQDFLLSSSTTGFAGASASYVGEREGVFAGVFSATAERQRLPSFAQFDLLVGVRHGTWTANLFINNVADKRGVLAGGIATTFPTNFSLVQPRTAGVSVSLTF